MAKVEEPATPEALQVRQFIRQLFVYQTDTEALIQRARNSTKISSLETVSLSLSAVMDQLNELFEEGGNVMRLPFKWRPFLR